MHNKFLVIALSLCVAGCGTLYSGMAFLDKSEEKAVLTKEFGHAYFSGIGNIYVVGSKQYVLEVLKKMSEQHMHGYEVVYDRKSAFVQYKADKPYNIHIHPGNTSEINEASDLNTFETYAYVEFEEPQGVSPQFKQLLMDAFKQEKTKHDPHEHINGVYTTNLKVDEVRNKLEQFFKKLYPTANFKKTTIHGKIYHEISVRRVDVSGLESLDNIYFLVIDKGKGQSQIQLHTANVSYTKTDGVFSIVPKEKSQQLLDTIVSKIGL